jgi:DNA-binding NtrC family response regulator
VALLAQSFVKRFAEEHASSVRGLDPSTLAVLTASEWPGNVRQLENALERAVLLCRGPWIETRDLPDALRPTNPIPAPDSLVAGLAHLEHLPTLKVALEGPERAILVRALELCHGHRLEAAEMLGINRSTLFNKMRKYDLQGLSFDGAGS